MEVDDVEDEEENKNSQQVPQAGVSLEEPMTQQKIGEILAFLEDLRSDPQAAAFNIPVNWRALNIPDYP